MGLDVEAQAILQVGSPALPFVLSANRKTSNRFAPLIQHAQSHATCLCPLFLGWFEVHYAYPIGPVNDSHCPPSPWIDDDSSDRSNLGQYAPAFCLDIRY